MHSDLHKNHFGQLLIIQTFLYSIVRFIMFWWLPMPAAWGEGRVWFNIDFFLRPDRRLLMNLLNLIFWYMIAILGIKVAPKELKRSIILFPFLLITTFLVGQFNEIRHFEAFIPIVIGLILCLVNDQLVKDI